MVREIKKCFVRLINGGIAIVCFISIMPKQLTIQATVTPVAV